MSTKHSKTSKFRLKSLAAVALTTALSLSLVPAQANTNEEAELVTLKGNYRLISATPAPGEELTVADELHFIETEDNELVQLHANDESELEELTPGSELTLTGTETEGITGEGIDLHEIISESAPEIEEAPSAGHLRTAVILIKKGANGTESITPEELEGIYFTNDNSAKNFFEESSWNKLTLGGRNGAPVGDVFGYLTIPATTSCSAEVIAGNNAARNAGIQLEQYDLVSYVIDSSGAAGCGYGGWAYVGGKEHVNLFYAHNPSRLPGTLVHEVGHNLGLRHAKSLTCTSGNTRVSLPAQDTNCSLYNYGDVFDVMGTSPNRFHYSAYNKFQLGWIPSENLVDVTTEGEYTIAPHTKLGTTPQLLRLKLGHPEASYVIDYRQPHGTHWESTAKHQAENPQAPALGGLLMRRVAPDGTELVRLSPQLGESSSSFPLRVGQSAFTDPSTGTTIQLLNAGETATVKISYGNGEFTSSYEQVYLRGTHNDWDTSAQMELVDNNTWEFKANFGNGNNERFKFDINGDWSHNYGDNNNDEIADYFGADIPITRGPGEYTITWHDVTRQYTVVKTPVPNQAPVAVTTPDTSLSTPAGVPVTFDGSESYDPDGTIVSYEWSLFGERHYGPTWTKTFDSPANFTVNFIIEDNDGARVSKQIAVNVTQPLPFVKNNPQVYLRGTHNDWATSTQMALIADHTWSTTINFTGNHNERFKFDINGDWSHNYGDNNNDGIADYNAADIPITQGPGNYTITWNELSRAYTITKQ